METSIFKPLLAATIDPMKDPKVFEKIKFGSGLFASPKLDGIRCVVKNGVLLSRSGKPIPNKAIQEKFKEFENYDGELIWGDATSETVYNDTQSVVMSKDKPADGVMFHVFDYTYNEVLNHEFSRRYEHLVQDVASSDPYPEPEIVKLVSQQAVFSIDDLLAFETDRLAQGYEGIMLRSPDGIYKQGRSTFREQILMKLKRFEDIEGVVVGFIEQMTNTNEAFKDELGHTKRSTAAAGLVPAGTLGKLLVQIEGFQGLQEVSCGVLTHAERQKIWDATDLYHGAIAKVRHFPVGAQDKLRFPRFVGWRDPIDL